MVSTTHAFGHLEASKKVMVVVSFVHFKGKGDTARFIAFVDTGPCHFTGKKRNETKQVFFYNTLSL
jgi:hypothetical protein